MVLAAIYDGKNRTQAAAVGWMEREILRHWIIRFNEQGPDGLTSKKSSGRLSKLTAALRSELREIFKKEPAGYVLGLIHWRCVDLVPFVKEGFGVECHLTTIARILHELGFSHISPYSSYLGPQHPKQDEQSIEEYKNFADLLAEARKHLPPDTVVEIWFQDEAGIRQKNGLVYQWAKKDPRPPKD